MALREDDSRPQLKVPSTGEFPQGEGVVLDSGALVAVSIFEDRMDERASAMRNQRDSAVQDLRGLAMPTTTYLGTPLSVEPVPNEVRAWPRLDAPEYVPARVSFDVTVGLAATQQAHTAPSAPRTAHSPNFLMRRSTHFTSTTAGGCSL
jgi:hypothetical protein